MTETSGESNFQPSRRLPRNALVQNPFVKLQTNKLAGRRRETSLRVELASAESARRNAEVATSPQVLRRTEEGRTRGRRETKRRELGRDVVRAPAASLSLFRTSRRSSTIGFGSEDSNKRASALRRRSSRSPHAVTSRVMFLFFFTPRRLASFFSAY